MRTGDFLVQNVSSSGAQIPLLNTSVRRAGLFGHGSAWSGCSAQALGCYTRAFSSCSKQGLFFVEVHWLLFVLSHCRAWASVVGMWVLSSFNKN